MPCARSRAASWRPRARSARRSSRSTLERSGEVSDSVGILAGRLGVARAGRGDRRRHVADDRSGCGSGAGPASAPRVFFAEWIEPPFCAGHWLPEMIELAGGTDILGRAGQPSYPTTWDEVIAAEPELVVIAPCGFGADEAAERAAGLRLPCPAVAVDGDSYYSRPAPRLADGVRQLAHLFHPERRSGPGPAGDRYCDAPRGSLRGSAVAASEGASLPTTAPRARRSRRRGRRRGSRRSARRAGRRRTRAGCRCATRRGSRAPRGRARRPS